MKRNNKGYLDPKIMVLQNHCKELIHYIKTNKLKRQSLHVMIGNKASGKTALLASLDIKYKKLIPAKHLYSQHISSNTDGGYTINNINLEQHNAEVDYCRFWMYQDSIILDMPSAYTMSNNEYLAPEHWNYLLDFIKKNRRYISLKSLIIAADIDDLQELQRETSPLLKNLKQRTFEISHIHKKPIPLFFIITQIDSLSGFSEYFDNLQTDERNSPIGVRLEQSSNSLLDNHTKLTMCDYFNKQYNNLLRQLNAHVIGRMHRERNTTRRAKIKEFPLQIESLQSVLSNIISVFIEQLSYCDAVSPKAIYFTSALQSGDSIDRLMKPISEQTALTISDEAPSHPFHSKPYFIKDIFTDELDNALLIEPAKSAYARKDFLKNFDRIKELPKSIAMSYGIAAAVIIASTTFLGYQYNQAEAQVQHAKLALAGLQSIANQDSKKPLNLLQALSITQNLKDSLSHLSPLNHSWLLDLHIIDKPNVPKLASETYHGAIQKILLPSLSRIMEHELHKQKNNPGQLYDTLKAYLMLNQVQHRNAAYLIDWTVNFAKTQLNFSPEQSLSLAKVLQNVVDDKISIPLSRSTIKMARTKLQTIPSDALGYLIFIGQVKEHIPNNSNNIELSLNGFKSNPSLSIPNIYTKQTFDNNVVPLLNKLDHKLIIDNWVIAKDSQATKQANRRELTSSILAQYFSHYTSVWQSQLSNLQLEHFDSLSSINASLNQGSGSLAHVLSVIYNNTSANSLLAQIPNDAPYYNALKQNINLTLGQQFPWGTGKNNAEQALQLFSGMMDSIATNSNMASTAFEVARLHSLNKLPHDPISQLMQADQSCPKFVATWFKQLAQNTWQLLMQTSSQFINSQWQQNIIPFYQKNIANRFPIDTNAQDSIAENDFETFFAPNGMLNNFFAEFIQPFLNTQPTRWEWRAIDGVKLSLSDKIPLVFERGQIITKMFFPNGNNKMDIAFSLRQLSMSKSLRQMTLNINGQTMVNDRDKYNVYHFDWPGSSSDQGAELRLIKSHNIALNTGYQGTWGLFRLLAHSKLSETKNPNQYQLQFKINDEQATYELSAAQLVNPFIPGIINQFSAPKQLG